MDKRLIHIRQKLGEYAIGKFHSKPLLVSNALDETDAIMTGINILGEELQTATISRDYFNNIFDGVSDMIFLLNKKGKVVDCNLSAQTQLTYSRNNILGKPFHYFFKAPFPSPAKICRLLKGLPGPFVKDDSIVNYKGEMIPVNVKARIVKDGKQKDLLLLTATDISYQQQAGNLIIRTIIDTQENERERLSKDLHDSLAQQLYGISYYINTTAGALRKKEQKAMLLKANGILQEALEEIRNICFNLMPRTLHQFGLVEAINELCGHFLLHSGMHVKLNCCGHLPLLNKELQIDVYRVMQELLNNVIKHACASQVSIGISFVNGMFSVQFADDGKGFDVNGSSAGMGLQNVKSRVKSHNGRLKIKSSKHTGTRYYLYFPILNPAI